MSSRVPAAVLPLVAILAACTRPEPAAERETLPAPRDTIVVPYADVTTAAWLGPGRWAVVAPQAPAVALVDVTRRTATPLGGRTSRELEQPFHLFRAGDTLYIADWQRHRLTLWSLDGQLMGDIQAPEGFRGALPRLRDLAGNWYFEARPAPGAGGRGNLDSAAVLRSPPGFGRADTVARLAPLDLAEVVSEGRLRLERRLLSGQDRWGATPAGLIWVARVQSNQVEWHDPAGRTNLSRQLPDRVLPISENDRQLFLARFDPGLRPTVEQIPFAAIKPPFEDALSGWGPAVWLVKSRAVGDTLREYQVVDSAARLVRYVAHRGIGHIVGLGEGAALVAEPFEHGVRLLEVTIPPMAETSTEKPR